MAVLPPSTDYTDRDFDALRVRLIALLQSVFPDWSDFDVASFGNLLLEMYCFVGDVLGYTLDAHARESRLVTATQRQNVIALARMLGYRLRGASAARAAVELALPAPASADVVVRAGATVRTEEVAEPIRFQLLEDARIPAGSSRTDGVAEHSQTHTQLADVTGLPNVDVVLERAPYLDGSAEVSANNGAYVEVPTLLSSGPSDRHFVVLVDQNDRATLRFGSGVLGAPPTGTVRVRYKTGGGERGNVDADRLRVLEGSFVDTAGRAVRISATNPRPAQGGLARETIASAKLRAPESLRALTRSVAREDFEIHARAVAGVARALMLTSNEDASIEENSGILFVVPVDGGMPTAALKNAVLRQVTEVYPCTLTFQVSVQDPVYRRVDVGARVFLREGHRGSSGSGVASEIRRRLFEHFRVSAPDGTPNPRVDFGFNVRGAEGHPVGELALSDVFDVVRDTVGVRKIGDRVDDFTLNGAHADVRLRIKEFPTLGRVTIVDGDTGALL